jgi:hypothetical protein
VGSWLVAIVDTGGRADFWAVARRHHVSPATEAVPPRVLIECRDLSDFEASTRLAQALSAELATTAIGLFMQTTADVYGIRVFTNGQLVRQLDDSREDGGWIEQSGTAQPWEPALLFDGPADPADDTHWPDTLDDDLEDADLARYEAARKRGDASGVMDLVHASQGGMFRLAAALGVTPDAPHGHHKKPSFWQRLKGTR